jgi:RNA polymerase sigma-32 factor
MRFILNRALKYKGYVRQYIAFADLMQEAMIGFNDSIDKFDESRGVRLTTLAIWVIQRRIHDYILHAWSMVRVKGSNGLFFSVLRRLDAGETVAGIAEKANRPPSFIENMRLRRLNIDVSLDHSIVCSDDIGTPQDLLTYDNDTPLDDTAAQSEQFRKLHYALGELKQNNPAAYRAIIGKFFRNGGEGFSFRELSEEEGVSHERVNQRNIAGLEFLRKCMEDMGL